MKQPYISKVISGRLLRPEEETKDKEAEPIPETSQYDHLFSQPYREIPQSTPIDESYWAKQDAMLHTKNI